MASERVERKLTAILAADVAGYSRLMGADEEGTLSRLMVHRRELVDPKIKEHKGRIVKTTGDGMLAEFASVVDAVRCAVDVQRGMAERNAGFASEERIEFRVGINLGDVIVEGEDLYGDGVNIAAPLEALAEPGAVFVSNTSTITSAIDCHSPSTIWASSRSRTSHGRCACKGAVKWTRLSCRSFAANAVRLQLHALAYNLGNFMRTLAMPEAAEPWSLTSLREKLIKIGAKVVSHGRYVTFQMAEVAVPRPMFAEILSLIARLRAPPAPA